MARRSNEEDTRRRSDTALQEKTELLSDLLLLDHCGQFWHLNLEGDPIDDRDLAAGNSPAQELSRNDRHESAYQVIKK